MTAETSTPEFKHPSCFLVTSLAAAEAAVKSAHTAGAINETVAKVRLAKILLRKFAVAAAQEHFNCQTHDETTFTEVSPTEAVSTAPQYVCPLPTGAVESFAFGDINNSPDMQIQLSNENGLGFKTA
jgi:hypothetical protein